MPDANAAVAKYEQSALGTGIAQAAGPGAQATVKIIHLPPPQAIDLAAAERRLRELPVDGIPALATLPFGSSVTFRPNPLFCGREAELKELAAAFKHGMDHGAPAVAISGIGGLGKSQLAVEFAHRYGQYFVGGVYWVSFAEAGAIPAEIANACAGLPDLPLGFQELDAQTQLGMILGAWRNDLPRLLVFDNCEDEILLEQWRPATGAAHVLLTSRRGEFAASLGVKVLALETLPRADSVELLQKFLASDGVINQSPTAVEAGRRLEQPATLAALAQELGDLPLALHVAGSYLSRYAREVTPAQYLAQLRGTDPLAHRSLQGAVGHSPTAHDLSVARTFALSYERLHAAEVVDRLARDLLARAACFAPGEPIPRQLLVATLQLSGDDADVAHRVADALHRLAELGLIATNENGDPYLHRLLGHFVLDLLADDTFLNKLLASLRLKRPTRGTNQKLVERIVIDEADRANGTGDPRILRGWQLHLRYVTDQALGRCDMRAAQVADVLGNHLKMTGDYAGAKPYYERSLAICEQVRGEQHPDTASILNNLGMLLYDVGDYAGAKLYLERSLAIYEQVLGEQHLDTAGSLNNLGGLLQDMGDLSGAKLYLERSLAIYEQVLGEQHPDTAGSLNNLGRLLYAMGDLSGARPYYERSLAIWEQVLGEQHPYTAGSLNNLGCLLQDMGDYAGAKPYHERSLAIREQVLGRQHPDTASSLNNLGMLLQDMGDYAGAKAYLERSLAIREQVLGAQHPDTAQSLNNLGRLLDDLKTGG